MALSDLPKYATVPAIKRALGLDRPVDAAIEGRALTVVRMSPNGWRWLEVEQVRRWLDRLTGAPLH